MTVIRGIDSTQPDRMSRAETRGRTFCLARVISRLFSAESYAWLLPAACLILAIPLVFAAQQTDSPAARAGREKELRRVVSKSLNTLGVFYFEGQESAKAIETLEEALKYDPDNADIRTNLAMIYLQQQQFEKVLETLGAVQSLNEKDPRAVTALAVCNFVLGRYERAVFFYTKLVQLQPADTEILLTLAVALHLNSQEEESKKVLERLPEGTATQAQYHVVLADAFRFRSKLPEALAEYEKARALAPDLPVVNYRLGVLQSELHEYDKAVESFRRELKISPNSYDASYSLGAYYLNYGNDPAAAKNYFEQTLQLNPQHLGAYLGLMKIFLNGAQAAEALQLAGKADDLARENEEFHYLKSRAYNLLGNKDLAEKELKIFEEIKEKKK